MPLLELTASCLLETSRRPRFTDSAPRAARRTRAPKSAGTSSQNTP
ncbi:hypothetical protein AG1IA_10407 [Rhizoctonia solani AG-1 IA]|uniref:Uncharacterized protein n=1 Tax=Thanatephorus cucumeris (strain AG1-IA) TaxID=983506 RepID=L8WFK2_THACA|nr:hypothetical protein AG1IA_10407 [Rhizoctonia solani AG-1 IA]